MVPGREIYWNISGYLFQYLFLGCSLAICTYGFWRRYRKWRAGTPSNRSGAVKKRIVTVAKQMISHSRIFGYPFTGIFHYSLVMAFFVLFLGTTAVFFEADFGIQILSGKFYLYFQSLALDTAGFVALIGIGSAVFQRFVLKPKRYQNMSAGVTTLIGLFVLLLSGFLVEGLRISATADPWGRWSFLGYAVSLPMTGIDIATLKGSA